MTGLEFTISPNLAYSVSLVLVTVTIGIGTLATVVFLMFGQKVSGEESRLAQMTKEKVGPLAGRTSFARVAGILGSLTLTSLFICAVYWAHFTIFAGGDLTAVTALWPLFTVGAALFAPYAFNRLRVFQGAPSTEG